MTVFLTAWRGYLMVANSFDQFRKNRSFLRVGGSVLELAGSRGCNPSPVTKLQLRMSGGQFWVCWLVAVVVCVRGITRAEAEKEVQLVGDEMAQRLPLEVLALPDRACLHAASTRLHRGHSRFCLRCWS
jgi:hypothetical protein